ncbi:MAG TPA: ribonuclease R [Acidobacteriota bacterium]|nr:ribonuclease R [Acidobacteriota bacterium]
MLSQSQKNQVLKYIESLTSRSVTFRDIVRLLDLDSDDRRSLQRYLDELDEEEIIHRVKRGRYTLPDKENLVSGVLSCHRDGYGFLIPDDRTRCREDVFIPARNMEDALHEDRVLVKIVRKKYPPRKNFPGQRGRAPQEGKERLEGVVVRVLERNRSNIVGRFYAHPRFPYVVPLDTRLIHDIRIPYHSSKEARDGQIVVVVVTLPPGRNQEAQGKVIEILGYAGDPGIEYKIVEHKFGLPVAFTPAALREAEDIPGHITDEEYAEREDFRGEMAITIDGETARDFDDAVSLKKLPSGNFLLGVHIADVSHYVREGTALDSDAYARGTSVYFPDRAIPMLPPRLSSGICSLMPGADRLVLSALIEIDPKGKVLGPRFAEGVLRSRERMTYTSVAKILADRDPDARARYAELVPLFETMEELCLILSKKRYRRGAVDFDLPEAEIQFDETGKVISVVPAERNIAHRIIEEFMLQANECVAEKLSNSRGPALYRVHEAPDPLKVEEFAEFAQSLGYRLEKHDGDYRPKDFQKFVLQMEGKPEQRFLVYLMLRSFMQAHYCERNLGHFGLAAAEYTHFTSPIRRYPDLLVHRLLKDCLSKQPSLDWRENMRTRLPELALYTSARERTADEAEREIEKIKKAQFMAGKIGEEFEAIVFSATRQGFFVELLEHYVEGFVPLGTLIDDEYQFREATRSFTGKRRRNRFQLGSRVRVRLDSSDLETGRLSFSVVSR